VNSLENIGLRHGGDRGGKVWYLMAKDEGHGFQKKKNADFQFVSTIQFFKENLVN